VNLYGTPTIVDDGDTLCHDLDLDSDNDGISDLTESGFTGIVGTNSIDTDSDSIPDYLDLDSDGDTIPDATEARASDDYIAYPATIDDAADSDDDGILDIYDDNSSFGSTEPLFIAGTNSPNSDDDDTADTIPDYLDVDSDDDGINDQTEAGTIVTAASYADPDGSVNDPLGSSDGLPNNGSEIATRMFSCPVTPPAVLSNRATFNY